MPLDEDVVRLAKGKNLATVVTLMPDGQPQALLTWIDTDGEHVLVNTEPQRQKARNVARDPRITVLIRGDDNYDWAEVRGHVVETIGGEPARQHIDELSERYNGHEYTNPIGPQGRVILKVAADKINTPKRLGRRTCRPPPARPPWRLPRPPARARSCGRPASRTRSPWPRSGRIRPRTAPSSGPRIPSSAPGQGTALPGAERSCCG